MRQSPSSSPRLWGFPIYLLIPTSCYYHGHLRAAGLTLGVIAQGHSRTLWRLLYTSITVMLFLWSNTLSKAPWRRGFILAYSFRMTQSATTGKRMVVGTVNRPPLHRLPGSRAGEQEVGLGQRTSRPAQNDPLPPARLPLNSFLAFPNSTTIWRPSVQTHEPKGNSVLSKLLLSATVCCSQFLVLYVYYHYFPLIKNIFFSHNISLLQFSPLFLPVFHPNPCIWIHPFLSLIWNQTGF